MAEATVRALRAETERGIQAAQGGRLDLAALNFSKALTHAEDLADDRVRRDEIGVLAALFDQFGFPDLALMAAEQAVELDRQLGLDALLHEDILSVGTAHLHLDNDAKAEGFFQEALDLALKRGDFANAASASTNIGNVLAKRGEMKGAISLYEKSLEYLAKEPFDDTEINTRIMLLQVSEIDGYDVDLAIENARHLCHRFWKDLQGIQRQAATQFVSQLLQRYLEAHPQKNPEAWKAKTFPMVLKP